MKVYEGRVIYKCAGVVESKILKTPEQVGEFMAHICDHEAYEAFWVLPMNRKNRCKGAIRLCEGSQSACIVSAPKILRTVLMEGCETFIVVHNHPSGDPAPSSADITVTRQIREAAKACDLAFLDHIILGHKELDPIGGGYYSFRESGIVSL